VPPYILIFLPSVLLSHPVCLPTTHPPSNFVSQGGEYVAHYKSRFGLKYCSSAPFACSDAGPRKTIKLWSWCNALLYYSYSYSYSRRVWHYNVIMLRVYNKLTYIAYILHIIHRTIRQEPLSCCRALVES
jgi:hypothetical protein